jgi:SAM-dependent methyltransferase
VAAEYLGRRVFFRAHNLDGKLPFADNGFDHVVANVSLADLASPSTLVAELVRVTKPGGELRLATPLAGTWREFLDVYSDVLVRLRRHESAAALAAYAKSFPEPEAWPSSWSPRAHGKVAVETTHWELVFRTGREFFYAPVIELGALAALEVHRREGLRNAGRLPRRQRSHRHLFRRNRIRRQRGGGRLYGTKPA